MNVIVDDSHKNMVKHRKLPFNVPGLSLSSRNECSRARIVGNDLNCIIAICELSPPPVGKDNHVRSISNE